MREWMLGLLLALAAGLVVRGVAGWSVDAAFVVGGLMTALFAWLFLGEVERVEPE